MTHAILSSLRIWKTYGLVFWGLPCQKQVSQADISNCIPQNNVGCNYLSRPCNICHVLCTRLAFCRVLDRIGITQFYKTKHNKQIIHNTIYLKKYAHGFCFAVLCCGYTLTDFPISIRLTSLALWQSNDCPSARKATLMNMDKCFMWIHYERLHNHNKAKHNKTVCIFLGIFCIWIYCYSPFGGIDQSDWCLKYQN